MLRKILLFLFVSLIVFSTTSHAWVSGGHTLRNTVTLNSTVSSTLTNYDAYFKMDTATLISAGKMKADCSDLYVTDTNDNLLPFHIISCDSANTVVKVLIASFTSTNTQVYAYYGKPSASDAQNKNGVYVSYDDVYNFEETATNYLSSVSGGLDIEYADSTTSNCKYGKCYGAGTNALNTANLKYDINTALSVSCHVYSTDTEISMIIGQRNAGAAAARWQLYKAATTGYLTFWDGGGGTYASDTPIATSTLTHIGFIFDGTNMKMYQNGVKTLDADHPMGSTSASSFNIGGNTDNSEDLEGSIDECKLSKSAKSEDWMIAEYAQTYSLAGEEAGGNNYVDVISPANGYFTAKQDVTFSYDVVSNTTGNAYLIINGITFANDAINGNTTLSHTITLVSGSYSWYVNYTSGSSSSSSSNRSLLIYDIDTTFSEYLNASIETCPTTTKDALVNCNEFYKLQRIYNYSAIVCPIQAQNFTCLNTQGVNNYTKNGYTILYTPSSWVYAGGLANITGIEHTGAVFYYSGAAINPGIELINSTHFIFVPSQSKDRDCTIKHTNTCSWSGGFLINNRQIVIADRGGQFYTTGGLAIAVYNESQYGNMTVSASLLPLYGYITPTTESGVFTKVSCVLENGTYTANLINTISKAWNITFTNSTNTTSYATSGKLFYYSADINSTDTNVTVTADGNVICSYVPSSFTMFNLDLSFMNIDILKYLYQMLGIFLIVISAISPYFLFGFIIFNDIYHSFTVEQVGMLTGFSIIIALISNYTTFERGLKHVVLLFFIFVAYLVALSPYWDNAQGVNFAAVTSFSSQFNNWQTINNMWDMAWFSVTMIIEFFKLILALPALVIDFIFALAGLIIPAMISPLLVFKPFLSLAFSLYVYVKAYEVITNKFRGV